MCLQKILLPALALLTLSACSEPVTEVITTTVDRPALIVPRVTPLSLKPVEWVVLTKDNAEQLLQDNYPGSYIALSAEDYENLALNMQDLQVYIKQQQLVIIAYKDYYERR